MLDFSGLAFSGLDLARIYYPRGHGIGQLAKEEGKEGVFVWIPNCFVFCVFCRVGAAAFFSTRLRTGDKGRLSCLSVLGVPHGAYIHGRFALL